MPGVLPVFIVSTAPSLRTTVKAIGQRVLAAIQSPGRAERPLHRRQDAAAESKRTSCDTRAAAKLSRPAGVLAQLAIGDEDRRFAFGRFHRRVMGIAVVDAKGRVLAVGVGQRAPTAAGQHRREMKRTAGLGIETEGARRGQVGVMTGENIIGTGLRQAL